MHGDTLNYEKIENMIEKFFKDRYTIEKLLGEGSFARVYLIKHKYLNERHALKFIKEPLTQSANTDNVFEEVQLATKLSHENVIDIHDAGIISTYGYDYSGEYILEEQDNIQAENWAYFILEYVPGGDLEEYRQSFRKSGINMPIMQVVNIIKQILTGLNTLHSANRPIIHRDLKAGNILMGVNSSGNIQVKISDFGFAKEVSSDSTADDFGGTKLYMSPESFKKEFSTRSDVYAVGVIFYLLLTNEYPYLISEYSNYDLQDLSTWDIPLQAPSTYNINIPEVIDDIILKSIAINPEQRYKDAKEFLERIDELRYTIALDDNEFFDEGVYQATSRYNRYNKLNINERIEEILTLAQTPGKLDDAIELLEKEIITDYQTRRNYTQIIRMWKSKNPDVKLILEAYKITLRAENYKLAITFIKEAIAINPSLADSYESTIKVWDLLSKLEKDEDLLSAVDTLEEHMKSDEKIKSQYNNLIDTLKTYSASLIVKRALELVKEDRQLEAARLMEFAVLKDKKYKTEYAYKIALWKQEIEYLV